MPLLIIAGITLLIFGPKRLPELGKGLVDGLRGFRAAMNLEAGKPEEAKTTSALETKTDLVTNTPLGRIAAQECGLMTAGDPCPAATGRRRKYTAAAVPGRIPSHARVEGSPETIEKPSAIS